MGGGKSENSVAIQSLAMEIIWEQIADDVSHLGEAICYFQTQNKIENSVRGQVWEELHHMVSEETIHKQLTIAVPAYNAERWLGQCLDSMVGKDPRLEVVVVDDGSTDGTGTLAAQYVERYPKHVRLISKTNGGHGSGINCAVKEADGRYFKVIDADDWIVRDNLTPLLDALERTEVDAIITGYHTIHEVSGKVLAFPSDCRYAGEEIMVPQLLEVYEEISSCCSFHGLFYRTKFYRDHGIQLSEGIFYEDHEYATLPFAYVETVLILPLFFCEYRIGNSGQSVAFHNQVKRIDHIETVARRIIDYRQECGPLRPDRDEYFLRKLCIVVVSYFAVALVKSPDRKAGEAYAERFYTWLAKREPEILERIAKKYRTLWLLHRVHFPAALYQKLLDTNLYKKFRKIWIN